MSTTSDKSLILNRIKSHYNLATNADLAKFMGIAPTTISSWYSRNTFDYDLLFAKCVGLDKEWLLTGEGFALKGTTASPIFTAQSEVPNYDQLKTIEQLRTEVEVHKDTIINLQGLVITLQQQLATAKSVIPANPITVKPKANPAGKVLVTQL